MSRAARRSEWIALAPIAALAAALRLINVGRVPPDPFYDAAVRSMGLSWHNFFFGAFEPSGTVSIDKPPVDLWLQVASVKALGFSATALKLPEVFAGVAAVPLCFALVRRVWGAPAALAAALALAVLPIEVITARSDTMDAVMMALIVLAALLIVRACEAGSAALLLAGAAALGVAFDVKLLESLVALPGLALLAYLGMPGRVRRRAALTALAGVVYVAVALSWLSATLLFPAHERPYAIGSTNGSAWNAAFVFNGTDRLGERSDEPDVPVYEPGHRYPQATQAERDHIPIGPPSPTRLLARVGPLSGERLGAELLAALILGIPALLAASRLTTLRGTGAAALAHDGALRVRRALAAGLAAWMLCGIVLFSLMTRLHPRYVESFTPAVAAMLGVGAAWACGARTRARACALAIALSANTYFVERLIYGVHGIWWLTLGASLGALALVALVPHAGARSTARIALPAGRLASLRGHAALALTAIALLALPFAADVGAIERGVTDAEYVGALKSGERDALSSFLRAHQGGAKYEVAAGSATAVGSLIVKDARPVLALTTYDGRVFTDVSKLRRIIAAGAVKYAFLNAPCPRRRDPLDPGCAEPALWVRAHGTDVSRRAGLRHGLLWLLPGARA